MDALTFGKSLACLCNDSIPKDGSGSPVLLRHLTFSEARKMPVLEFNLKDALAGMDLTMDQVCRIGVMV